MPNGFVYSPAKGNDMSEKKENTITVSQTAWDELQARLLDAETHRKGLLEHTHNLEHLLNEAQKHAQNLVSVAQQRAENMTELFAAREKDLAQTKALCYKYEQLLLEAGVDLTKV
jgi:cell division septum initiation protein DivIVA